MFSGSTELKRLLWARQVRIGLLCWNLHWSFKSPEGFTFNSWRRQRRCSQGWKHHGQSLGGCWKGSFQSEWWHWYGEKNSTCMERGNKIMKKLLDSFEKSGFGMTALCLSLCSASVCSRQGTPQSLHTFQLSAVLCNYCSFSCLLLANLLIL